ncbi:tyrosine-protein kinase receptor torso-like isoform X1 [Hydra vulgaris]|uniref:Tyrosine-protein kinase receptor torso-like isoform X1 n=1 Tax=Hydra vulgaris TaxID=6087 RepID=A0ABM4CK41_HYDVU
MDHHLHADIWEILPENIILDRKIGEGAFDTVFIGKINDNIFTQKNFANQKSKTTLFNIKENVAVKFLKDNANQSEFDDFLEEIKLMKQIGYHKNIVNMIGCSTITKPLCLVVEFMENGYLLHYLRNSRNKLTSSKEDGESCISFMYTDNYIQTLETKKGEEFTSGFIPYDIPLNNIGCITPDDLLSLAWQIASGMEYLSFVKLVHRDLAARNILVGATKNVKISDFGLSRKTNNELNYTSNKSRRLPVKWMSVEAIFDQIFTTYSDVWAYGVVLFEIVTLGGTPYPSMSNHELIERLKFGYRMERPENCSQPLYDIMLHCWNEDPLKRPTFTELREQFDKILCQGDSYCNFDVYEKNDYSSASFQSEKSEMFVNSLNNGTLQKPAQLKLFEEQSDERYSCQISKDEINEAEI